LKVWHFSFYWIRTWLGLELGRINQNGARTFRKQKLWMISVFQRNIPNFGRVVTQTARMAERARDNCKRRQKEFPN